MDIDENYEETNNTEKIKSDNIISINDIAMNSSKETTTNAPFDNIYFFERLNKVDKQKIYDTELIDNLLNVKLVIYNYFSC
jgi:hypothetical protein